MISILLRYTAACDVVPIPDVVPACRLAKVAVRYLICCLTSVAHLEAAAHKPHDDVTVQRHLRHRLRRATVHRH